MYTSQSHTCYSNYHAMTTKVKHKALVSDSSRPALILPNLNFLKTEATLFYTCEKFGQQ